MDIEQSIYLKETNKLKVKKIWASHHIKAPQHAQTDSFLMMLVGKKRNSMFNSICCVISETAKEGQKKLSHSYESLRRKHFG